MPRVPRGDAALAQAFGHRVATLRLELGLSQEALAHEVGFHRTFVGRVERGESNVSLQTIVDLAAGLGCEPEELVRGLGPAR